MIDAFMGKVVLGLCDLRLIRRYAAMDLGAFVLQ
jgi:hypothetical protein